MAHRPPRKNVVVVDPLGATDATTTSNMTTTTLPPAESVAEFDTPPNSEPPPRPVPENQLTPEQRRIRELEDQLAREQGKKDPEPEYEVAQPGSTENILIHILEDGFTALGRVWYRGQELEFTPGSQPYRDTFDRRGWSWLTLVDDEFAQVDKYGSIKFRRGPWPGKPLTAAASLAVQKPLRVVGGDASVTPPTEAELEAAQAAELKRNRAAPRLAVR
jgi:hypothetical protein